MKLLIIDTDGVALSFAWRAVAAGHAVRWFIEPKPSTNHKATGNGFRDIEKVDNWVPSMGWADLVICTGNDKYLERLDMFRKRGYPVFGPTPESAKLEISRGDGMKLLEKVGIETAPYKTFPTLEAAKKHVEKTEERFVFKTLGDNEDKSLTYCSKTPADMIAWIESAIEQGNRPKGPVMLQQFIDGIEMGVSRFLGSKGWVGQWNESFEHKKLMPGNYGPNCFTPDAEVLTREGWKLWPDVGENDEICTLKDGLITYDKPSQVVIGDFNGELIGWQSPYVDLLVTPGHNLYVQDDHGRYPFFFEAAAETESKSRRIGRGGGEWIGNSSCVDDENYAALLGIYIADGYAHRSEILFGNCPEHKRVVFSKIIEQAGYRWKIRKNDLVISSGSLSAAFVDYGLSHQKYVPQKIKDASVSVISAFLRGYGAGDGTMRENNLTYTTVSKRLADDLQELCLKVGWAASVSERDRVGQSHMLNGCECINRFVAYDVRVSQQKLGAEINQGNTYREHYEGKVYCVTVPSHIIYVRRNGKACWSGQTGETGTIAYFAPESKLGDDTLGKLQDELIKLRHTGDSALGFIIDDKGKPWPTEWTCRFGWPIANMMLGATSGDPVAWMKSALAGEDTTSFREDIGCCLVLAHADFPHGQKTKTEVSGVPIYGVTKGNRRHIHPQGVQITEKPDMQDEKVVRRPVWNTTTDYAAVVTGFGKTVKQATDRAYGTMKQLHVRNAIVRDDIGETLKEQLPKLHALGYAKHCQYEVTK